MNIHNVDKMSTAGHVPHIVAHKIIYLIQSIIRILNNSKLAIIQPKKPADSA